MKRCGVVPALTEEHSFRCKPIVIDQLTEKTSLLRTEDGRYQAVYESPICEYLSRCLSFQSLEAHAKKYWSSLTILDRIPLMSSSMRLVMSRDGVLPFGRNFATTVLKKVLEQLVVDGFLTNFDEFVALELPVSGSGSSDERSSITTVALMTCDRPSFLLNSLESYLCNTTTYGRHLRHLISDDSRGSLNLEILHELKTHYSESIEYIGREQRTLLIEKLASAGFSRDVVEFALFGLHPTIPTYGASRNSVLLATSGEMVFNADDDTVCQPVLPRTAREEIRLGSEFRIQELRAFENRTTLLDSIQPINSDFLGAHESLLGLSPRRIMATYEKKFGMGAVSTAWMNGTMMAQVQEEDSRVRLTLNGLYGDSGMTDAETFLFLEGDNRKIVVESESEFMRAMKSREITKFSNSTVLSPAGQIMTTFFGLDNRTLNPPFFPMFRNEDDLFGNLIGAGVSGSLMAHLPEMLLHNPESNRSYHDLNHAALSFIPYPNELITFILDERGLKKVKGPASTQMRWSGSILVEIATMDRTAFVALLTKVQSHLLAQSLINYEGVLSRNNRRPPYWAKMVRQLIDSHYASLKNKASLLVPPELHNLYGGDRAIEELKRSIRLYGQLLQQWPDMIEAVKTFVRAGFTFCKKVS